MIGKKIVILATGGTIAGTASSPQDNVGYSAAQVGVAELVAAAPALAAFPLIGEQVAQIDSKDMSFEVWQALARRCRHWLAEEEVGGVVITHGSDTLEETAFFLHEVLAATKSVVVTCAMRPATSMLADGPQNLMDAVAVASSEGAHGVVAVCAGAIHGAPEVRKVHTYRLDAFASGDAGPLGRVEEGRLRMFRPWPSDGGRASAALDALDAGKPWPRVEIVGSYAGVGRTLVDALLAQGVDGLVVAGTGNGTVHAGLHAALLRARSSGVAVVRSTRCAEGVVLPRPDDSLAGSGPLSPVKARIRLMLDLLSEGLSLAGPQGPGR